MQIACPKCKADIPVPAEVTQKGVSRVQCAQCEFSFIIRLGEPGQAKPKGSDRPAESLKGVKASGLSPAFAGEIGAKNVKFKAPETQATIKIDPDLRVESQLETKKYEQLKIESSVGTRGDPTEREFEDSSPANMDTSPIFTPPVLTAEDEIPDANMGVIPDTYKEASQGIARVSSGAHVAPEGIPLPELPDDLLQPVPGVPTSAFSTPYNASQSAAQVAIAPQGIQLPPEHSPGRGPNGPETYPTPGGHFSNSGAPSSTGSNVTEMIYAPNGTYAVFAPVTQEKYIGTQDGTDPWEGMLEPTGEKNHTTLGLAVTVILAICTLLFFFILYQNDWSLDLANFSRMIDRAFGRESGQPVDQLRSGLVITPPIVEEATLASGERVIIAKGAIKNSDSRPRKFIYVRALLKDNHGRVVVSDEAPAGSVLSEEQIAQMLKSKLMADMNPAGRDGSNAKLEAGASIGFMVIITDVPQSYSSSKYKVSVEISQVEFFDES